MPSWRTTSSDSRGIELEWIAFIDELIAATVIADVVNVDVMSCVFVIVNEYVGDVAIV